MKAGRSNLGSAIATGTLIDRIAAETTLGVVYIRYRDDWVVLASSRWQLRRAIRAVRQEMARLRVVPHPDKTALGRTSKGFDFLGYWVTPAGVRVAARTVGRMVEKVGRLNEQGATTRRIDRYLHHWRRWVTAGLGQRLLTDPLEVGLTARRGQGYFRHIRVCCVETTHDPRIGYLPERRG